MFTVVILQGHTMYLFIYFQFLLMPLNPLFHVTLWALLFWELSRGPPLCASALIVDHSVRSASGVQCWSCSHSCSSPSRSVLTSQKHCLIRHWGRWPPPIFFPAKQASLSAPHLLWWDAWASLQQPFFGDFFFFATLSGRSFSLLAGKCHPSLYLTNDCCFSFSCL